MHNYNVKITSMALSDLKEISDTLKTYVSTKSANKFLNAIEKSLQTIRSFPFIGTNKLGELMDDPNYKLLFTGNYVIAYYIGTENVFVYGIADARRNYINLFRQRNFDL